jgi:hypothetical protein
MASTQKGSIGVCSGCGRKRPIINVKNQWCDACRKKVSRHHGEDPLAVLGARGRWDPHFASRGKLFKIDRRLNDLIAALADIGVPEEAFLDIRRIVEPFLAPISVALGLGRPAPQSKPKKKTTKAEARPKARSEPQATGRLPLVSPAPVAASPIKKRRGRAAMGSSDPEVAYRKARKIRNQINLMRRKKGLPNLPPSETLVKLREEALKARAINRSRPREGKMTRE